MIVTFSHDPLSRTLPRLCIGVLVALWLPCGQARAQNGTIVSQTLDSTGNGYTILKVWGTPQEMGAAHGALMAKEILAELSEMKTYAGTNYAALRLAMLAAIWKPVEIEQEINGLVSGVKIKNPLAQIDAMDVKVINTYGDWGYACRSHSAWGSLVSGSTKTLSTRRLDFSSPFSASRHHLLLVRDPSAGVRFVSLGWPGFVVAVTAVNEFGTLASLHDYQTTPALGAHLPRSLLPYWGLTLVKGLTVDKHLDAVWTALQGVTVATGTFFNYYVPQGKGGVITCPSGGKCNKKRLPQSDYFKGQVLLTTNAETDGHTTPSGGEFMASYYQKAGTKAIADHYALMGHNGLHLMTVDFRAQGDMTIWFEGEVKGGVTPTVKIEWTALYGGSGSPDSGVKATDAGPKDLGVQPEALAGDRPGTDRGSGREASMGTPDKGPPGSSCACADRGCAIQPGGEADLPGPLLLVLLGAAVLARARTMAPLLRGWARSNDNLIKSRH